MRRSLALLPAALLLAGAGELPETAPVPTEAPREATPDPEPEKTGEFDDERGGAEAGEPPPDPAPPPPDEAALAVCEAQLKEIGAVFSRREAIDGPGSCGISASYELKEAAPGVSITPATQMDCATALSTAHWVRNAVIPAARAVGENVSLTGIRHASTYVCRTRNGQPDAKISEHARGAAIDVTAFEFEGREPIAVEPRAGRGSIEEAFQRAVRATACLYFTTVLGPGSDAYHDDHLHLDLAQRRRGYRLCQ